MSGQLEGVAGLLREGREGDVDEEGRPVTRATETINTSYSCVLPLVVGLKSNLKRDIVEPPGGSDFHAN